jgi:hypothetical protein
LNDEHFDLIIVDRHLGGWLSPQACGALVPKAKPIPVAGLINDKCVLDLRDGIEAGLIGVSSSVRARSASRTRASSSPMPSRRFLRSRTSAA